MVDIIKKRVWSDGRQLFAPVSTELQKTKKCQRTLDTNDFKVKFDFPPASLYNIQYTTGKGYSL